MGQKLKVLSRSKLDTKAVFNNRMVVEVCEGVHLHYRNMRVCLSVSDWESMSKGMVDAYERWQKMGEPSTGKKHIELCRKQVATFPYNEGITISLNRNLYGPNEGRIYSDGAGIRDEKYVHVKIRDMRLEMPVDEFKQLAGAFTEAFRSLEDSRLQETSHVAS